MKDQYFGDVNDYRKYGLLRALRAGGLGELLVGWMLTGNDKRCDGNMREYLDRPDRWRHIDSQLYDGLRQVLQTADRPRVSLMHDAKLLPRTRFFSDIVPDERVERAAWRRRMLLAAQGADLVFLDPDNGIEVKSRPVGRKDSSKYVTWSEIEQLWRIGCSVLVYQHFTREKREAFVERLSAELRQRTGAPLVAAFRTPHVLFLLAAQEQHQEGVAAAIDGPDLEAWRGQIDLA